MKLITTYKELLNEYYDSEKLYDKNVISNQQFDNAKRQGRANVRESYNTALTNRAKTDALNQIYPQMQVDAGVGGKVYYDASKAKKMKPTSSKSVSAYIAECKADGVEEKSIMDCVKVKQQADGSTASGNDADILAQHFAKGGFIYSDITYPFIL
jgi:uncharacterized protein (UPF0335 family)